jgi:hypothetical protein
MRDGALLGVNPGTVFAQLSSIGGQRVTGLRSVSWKPFSPDNPRRISETKQCSAMASTHHSYAPPVRGHEAREAKGAKAADARQEWGRK